jgi:hypothetical protein
LTNKKSHRKLAVSAILLIIFIFDFIYKVNGQTLDKKFTGSWAMTFWTFEFYKDNTYKRTSTGHYGNSAFSGRYTIQNDTVELLDGYDNSNGTLNRYYLLSNKYSEFGTRPKGRLIDLANLYEYYDNGFQYSSSQNKIYHAEITDSLNKLSKAFLTYVPISEVNSKTKIDLGWCIEFFDYPANLKKAYLSLPDILDETDEVFLRNIFDRKGRLVTYYYNGKLPGKLDIEYTDNTNDVKKITDSKDGANYNFKYDNENKNILMIDYFTRENKRISQLKITE